MSVKAKFTCSSVIPFEGYKVVNFHAVYSDKGENADYSKYTPSANLSMVISDETKAADFFKQGENFYLTFEKANV